MNILFGTSIPLNACTANLWKLQVLCRCIQK
jgi:hypothetical protein